MLTRFCKVWCCEMFLEGPLDRMLLCERFDQMLGAGNFHDYSIKKYVSTKNPSYPTPVTVFPHIRKWNKSYLFILSLLCS